MFVVFASSTKTPTAMGTIFEQCFANDGNYFKAFKFIRGLGALSFLCDTSGTLTEWQEFVYHRCHAIIKVKAAIAP